MCPRLRQTPLVYPSHIGRHTQPYYYVCPKISDEEINNRRKLWQARINDYTSGALWKYTQTVGSARYGAVTHGGAKVEKISYDKL